MALIPIDEEAPQREPQQVGAGSQIARQIGLGTRAAITPSTVGMAIGGALGAPAGPPGIAVGGATGAAIGSLLELGLEQYNKLAPAKLPSEVLEDIKDVIGLPRPETPIEEITSGMVSGAAETVGPAGIAKTVATRVPGVVGRAAETLAQGRRAQMAAGAMAGGAEETAEALGAGETGQTVAGVGGAFAPNIPSATAAVTRRVLGTRVTPEEIVKNVEAFRAAGTEPTMAQVTGGRTAQGAEVLLSRVPGGAGVMAGTVERQQREIGERVGGLAEEIAPGATPMTAGAEIKRGITEAFIPAQRDQQRKLYGALSKYIPAQSSVQADNTISILNELTKPIARMENLSRNQIITNKFLEGLKRDFSKDVLDNKGNVPYEGLAGFRTRIGERLERVDLAPEIDKQQLNRLYGAISEDMREAARRAGPEAETAFNQANEFTRKFHERIDRIQPVVNRLFPEDVYNAAISGTLGRGRSTQIAEIMSSLPGDARKEVASAFLQKMGTGVPSVQDASGQLFSAETFLTNWAKLSQSKGAKEAIFGGVGGDYLNNLNKIAKASEIIREGTKVFPQRSGTTPSYMQIATIGGITMAGLSGQLKLAGLGVAGLGAANLSARFMTNPKAVAWLAKNYEKPVSSMPAAINELMTKAERDDDRELEYIATSLKNQSIKRELGE